MCTSYHRYRVCPLGLFGTSCECPGKAMHFEVYYNLKLNDVDWKVATAPSLKFVRIMERKFINAPMDTQSVRLIAKRRFV